MPSWISTVIQYNELQDESNYLQLGYDETTEYLSISVKDSHISAWREHPSENPSGLYKLVSLEVNLDMQKNVITR